MKVIDILKALAEPFRPPSAAPLKLMGDVELAEHAKAIEARIAEGEATLRNVQVELAEAAAEAFADGDTAVVTQNSKAIDKAKASLDGLRTTLRGLHLEQERRAQLSAADRVRIEAQARIDAFERVGKLIPRYESWLAGKATDGGARVARELVDAAGRFDQLLGQLPEARRDTLAPIRGLLREVEIALAFASDGALGSASFGRSRWAIEHPTGEADSRRLSLTEFWEQFRPALAEDYALLDGAPAAQAA